MLDVLDDFVWVLRRDGFTVSVPQVIDAARAARELGFADRSRLREALACVLADSAPARDRLFSLFDAFFGAEPPASDPWLALERKGFRPMEVSAMRELFVELSADPSMAAPRRLLIRERLAEAFGAQRSLLLTAALVNELDGSVRLGEPKRGDVRHRPFGELSTAQVEQVRRAVQILAQRLEGAARVRSRHRRRGRVDSPRTLRDLFRTGGVPFRPVRRDQRRERPRLVVLCDVRDSVRPAARFVLELVHALRALFASTRSFVFVSEIGEVTGIFEREPVDVAVAKAASVVNVRDAPSYGRAFAAFEARFLDAVDGRTTVVIFGDGQTNDGAAAEASLARIRERAQRVLWLCTDLVAIPRLSNVLTAAMPARCAADLENAARHLLRG